MKHCKDCKYCIKAWSSNIGEHYKCVFGANEIEDMVTGGISIIDTEYCSDERNSDCGPEAKNYKPKWYLWWRK